MKHLITVFMILLFCASCGSTESLATVKKSNLAGRWYSADRAELAGLVDSLLARAAPAQNNTAPILLILPHAGYMYSGGVAAAGYRAIGGTGAPSVRPGLIVIMGPTHHAAFKGCALLDADYYETPLGRVAVDNRAAGRLLASGLFRTDPAAYEQEHSIEIHLPFLQRIYGSAIAESIRVLPILVGELDDEAAMRTADVIASAVAGEKPLFIVSSDFTHYGPNFGYVPFVNESAAASRARLKGLDEGAIDLILKRDLAGFSAYAQRTGITICGRRPITIAMALPIAGFRSGRIAYDTSGSVTGSYDSSVSYAAIAFSGRLQGAPSGGAADSFTLPESDKRFLLRAARDNIRSWLKKKRGIRFFPTDVPKSCLEKRGVFVTLKKRGELRGCIGYISGIKPLLQGVLDNSYNAAFKDPRFEPLAAGELKEIAIEISVLSEPVKVRSAEEIRTGRDGLIVERGPFRGLLLPQVAVEQGWDRERFLEETCRKAGLPADAWKDGRTAIYRFQAVIFGEEGK